MAETAGEAWRLAFAAPSAARDRFAAAIEPFAKSLAVTEPDRAGISLIEAIMTAAPDEAAIRARIALLSASLGLPEPEISLGRLPEEDWLAASRRAFAPFRVGRFLIHDSEHPTLAPGTVPLCIESGMAFGTGRHGSTRGCLLALQALARSRSFANAFDLGCGSGILSVAAARLWRCRVLACDVDGEAVAATRAAAAKNGLGGLIRTAWGDGPFRRRAAERAPFDLVIANIVPKPLLALSRGLAGALAPGGAIVLSGMTAGEVPPVERRYRALGLRLAGHVDAGPWRTIVFERPASGRRALSLVRGGARP